MNRNRFAGLLVLAAIVLASCGKKGPEYTRYIPKSAGYVLAFDVKSMVQKLEKDSLSIENMMQVLKDEKGNTGYTEALDMWKQFKDAGIDFQSRVFVAVPEMNFNGGSLSFQLVAGLEDAAKLEAFIGKQFKDAKIEKMGDISVVSLPMVSIGWKKDAVMMLGKQSTADYGMVDMNDLMGDTAAGNTTAPVLSTNTKEDIKKYFELKKDESVASIDVFNELMEKPADVAMFTSSESATGVASNPFMNMMPQVKELIADAYSTSVINFEDGKIVIEGDSYVGKKLGDLLKKYAGPVVDMSLVERYPNANVNGVTAFSFKPELLPAFVKELGVEALVNMALSQGGVTADEIAKAFKGDFAIVFSDFAFESKTFGKDASYKSVEPTGKLLMAIRIGDIAAFDKLIGLAEKEGGIRREGNRLVPVSPQIDVEDGEMTAPMPQLGVFAGIEGDLLIISNDSTVYANYASGKAGAKLPEQARTALKDQSVGFYLNTPSILKGIPETMFDSSDVHEKNILNRSKEIFGDVWFSSGNFDGKKLTTKGEMKMAPGKNTLPQLVRYLMFIADEMKAKEKEEEEMYKRMEAEIELQ